jgi:hypothetical protein
LLLHAGLNRTPGFPIRTDGLSIALHAIGSTKITSGTAESLLDVNLIIKNKTIVKFIELDDMVKFKIRMNSGSYLLLIINQARPCPYRSKLTASQDGMESRRGKTAESSV